MVVVWRGWGMIGFVGVMVGLVVQWQGENLGPRWLQSLVLEAGWLASGVVLVACGRRWNRPATRHSLYGVPLQGWGWAYVILAGLASVLAVDGGLQPRLGDSPSTEQAAVGALGAGATLAAGALLVVLDDRRRAGSKAADKFDVEL